ncbi:hypothetical protein BDZ91DRAFT_798635 [Kalaharituber pfeilii]|nr:hypothetical protein BDZ91DRAFT_798635 [Kalaharituber pfeilii]
MAIEDLEQVHIPSIVLHLHRVQMPNWATTTIDAWCYCTDGDTGSATTSPPVKPDATTKRNVGIVVHGIALRKDLGKIKQWLQAANKDLGKITGVRWLRKRTLLEEEGKKTSSVVLYLEKETDVGKVKLSGRWLRTTRYESERGRKE